MMFELALRLRQSMKLENNSNADTTTTNKLIICGQFSTILFTVTEFIVCVVFVVIIVVNRNGRLILFFAFYLGYSFLIIAVVMGCANTFLIV